MRFGAAVRSRIPLHCTAQPRGLLAQLLRGQCIGFVERYHFGLVSKPMAVGLDLCAHGVVGRAGILRGTIDEVEENPATLDVTKKSVAKTGTLMRALDQAGDIRKHELAAVDLDHAELRMQGRKGVVRDLRLCGPPRREECGIFRISGADE